MILRGYYAILDVHRGDGAEDRRRAERGKQHWLAEIAGNATQLLAARPCMLQIRAKGAPAAELAELARLVLPMARAAGVPLCVNDRLDVALAVGADAVHLGQDDLPLAEANQIARGRLKVGISTHSPAQARLAIRNGADYIGFGPVFATATKANPDRVVGLPALRAVTALASQVAAVPVPVVAIGGITLDRVAEVAAAGAAAAALIGAIQNAADPVAAGRAINAAFGRPRARGGVD
jgi:thiamine-phosphate pyrophosphorylase